MSLAYERPTWHAAAACHGLTSLFFPERGESLAAARAVCKTCTVTAQCKEAGRHEHFGVWAGQAERGRRRDRRDGPISMQIPIAHGTMPGARQHYRRGDPPCTPCRIAMNIYSVDRQRDARERRRAAAAAQTTIVRIRPTQQEAS